MSDLGLRVDEMLMKQEHLKDEIDLMMKQLKRANELYAQGREDERKAIVEWLRNFPVSDKDTDMLMKELAAWIERGDHLRGNDE